MVVQSEIGDARRARVFGRGLVEGRTFEMCDFIVDTRDAGEFPHKGTTTCYELYIDSTREHCLLQYASCKAAAVIKHRLYCQLLTTDSAINLQSIF